MCGPLGLRLAPLDARHLPDDEDAHYSCSSRVDEPTYERMRQAPETQHKLLHALKW